MKETKKGENIDPNEITPGSYWETKGGFHASIWDMGTAILHDDQLEQIWLGKVVKVGVSTWSMEGKNLSGKTEYDLVKQVPRPKTKRDIYHFTKEDVISSSIRGNKDTK